MTSISTITKMTGRPAVASCLSGAFSRSRVAVASTLIDARVLGRVDERPFQAPAAAAAQASRYALAANGAGLRQQWVDGGFTANGTSEATKRHLGTTQHHSKVRAFRGLEPWRDPA
jgi:hypothetical protein